jgi:hypothetical protein
MKLFDTKQTLSEKELNKGLRTYVVDGVTTMGVATLQGGVYLVAFALAMGASQMQVGLIASIAFLRLPGCVVHSAQANRPKEVSHV